MTIVELVGGTQLEDKGVGLVRPEILTFLVQTLEERLLKVLGLANEHPPIGAVQPLNPGLLGHVRQYCGTGETLTMR